MRGDRHDDREGSQAPRHLIVVIVVVVVASAIAVVLAIDASSSSDDDTAVPADRHNPRPPVPNSDDVLVTVDDRGGRRTDASDVDLPRELHAGDHGTGDQSTVDECASDEPAGDGLAGDLRARA